MNRRHFLAAATGASAAFAADASKLPSYRVVTKYKAAGSGIPGPYPGRVIAVHSDRCIDSRSDNVDRAAVREMLNRGMMALTGDSDTRAAWSRFVSPSDVVGIKINASGAPDICSHPAVVGEIARNLVDAGVKPENIWVHERFKVQVDTVNYAADLPKGTHVVTADSYLGYDPSTYVDTSFFGEDDTRSNLVRLVSDKLTKIINVPNMKDHSAAGVTGCLKNIAYGEFGNVARSHQNSKTNTFSFIGTLASVEPLRSRTVLHIMDGLKGVWHGGPFALNPRFRFYPKRLLLGTDPVAVDRQLLDLINEKRKAEKATSVWDRSAESLKSGQERFSRDPNANLFIREPGHIEYAAGLGLGVYDQSRIHVTEIQL